MGVREWDSFSVYLSAPADGCFFVKGGTKGNTHIHGEGGQAIEEEDNILNAHGIFYSTFKGYYSWFSDKQNQTFLPFLSMLELSKIYSKSSFA